MTLNCYQLSDELNLKSCEYSWAINALALQNTKIFIDLLSDDVSDLEAKLDDLKIHGFVRRLCLESNNHPGFYPLIPVSMIVLPVYTDEHKYNNLEYITLLFNETFLFSFRNKEMIHFQNDILAQDAPHVSEGGIAGLVASLLLGLSLVSLKQAAHLSGGIIKLEEKMNLSPQTVQIRDISEKQLEMLSLESVVPGQLPVVQALIATEKSSLNFVNMRDYLTMAASNLQSTHRTLEWLERRLDVMNSSLDAKAQEKMNSRLGRLTVLSTIFMPITFLAGVWGMNFEFMPGLSFKYGYLFALLTMLIIGTGMYFSFKKKGWFD
jgi:magnesium transporter